jgi:parallel beta-helix repeat protein
VNVARVLVVLLTGCGVALVDPAGRACDETHPCRDGRVCVAGVCSVSGGTAPSSSSPTPAPVPVSCTHVVAPSGSDEAPGTPEAPFRTLARLARQLGPGVVGCLRTGTYAADLLVERGGTASAPAVVRSYPGERAKLEGRLLVMPTASFLTLAELDIDGTNTTGDSGPVVLAPDVTIEGCDLTSKNRDGCLRLGDPLATDASRAVVRKNRIHDCGTTTTSSASGVKVANGTGMRIVDNEIYGNKDHGILLYPSAQATVVTGNIVDGNGRNVVLGGTAKQTSNDNVIEGNVLTFPVQADSVASFFDPAAVGRNNVVRRNCLFGGGGAEGGIAASRVGFTAEGNVVGDPKYVDRAAHDFRLGAGSACASVLERP